MADKPKPKKQILVTRAERAKKIRAIRKKRGK